MLFPLGTDRPLKRPTQVTYWLIGINVVVYLGGMIYGSQRVNPEGFKRLYEALVLDPQHLTIWGPFTFQFLHAGLMHLLGNMLFLYVFGPNVEDRLGRGWFALFYVTGGAVAGLSHVLFEAPIPESGGIVPGVVGASGAIAAVTGAYVVLFPKTLIRLFVFFGIIGIFHVPAVWFIGAAILKDLLFQAADRGEGVALIAHLGGYAFGAATALLLLWTKLLAREPYDLFSIGRQAHRRRVFKELTSSGHAAWTSELGGASRVRASAATNREEDAKLERRAEIARAAASGETDRAAALYESLLREWGEVALPRQTHLQIAAHFYQQERYQVAAEAYEIFLRKHPSDREDPSIRLMLATICARYLNDPVKAKSLLAEVRSTALDDTHRSLAEELARELG